MVVIRRSIWPTSVLALFVAIMVVVILFVATLFSLNQLSILGVVGVATFIVTYWALGEEHRRKRV